jgi:putative SOS response-associated peptidase YedK
MCVRGYLAVPPLPSPLVGILRVVSAERRSEAALSYPSGGSPAFAMAGETWVGEVDTISCVTILTTEPNNLMKTIHDRMPVVLPKDAKSE